MLLKDLLLVGSLFTAIENSVAVIPTEYTVEMLDDVLLIEYGERTLYSPIANMPLDKIGFYVGSRFSNKWHNLVLLHESITDVTDLNGTLETETVTESENRNNVRDDLNKISAYNSTELIDNDGMNSTSNESVTGETVRTLKNGSNDINEKFNNLSSIEKNNIMNTVVKDVVNLLTLSIY